MNPRTARILRWALVPFWALIAIALIVFGGVPPDNKRRADLQREADALWKSLGVSSWSEVEDADVNLPAVQRLLEIENELGR
jgi:hypothetical protein